MAQMTWTFSDVYTKVSEFLGLGPSPSGSDLTKVRDLTYRGYMMFLNPVRRDTGEVHVWSFLKKQATIVTKSGEYRYPLPRDYDRLVGPVEFAEDEGYPPIELVPFKTLRHHRASCSTESYPNECSVVWGRYAPDTGQQREIHFYPTPDSSYVLDYTYVLTPPKVVNDSDYFVGGATESETILQCALAVAEFQEDETIGPQNAKAREMLESLMLKDEQNAPDTAGILRDSGLITVSPYMYRQFWVPSGSISAYGNDIV